MLHLDHCSLAVSHMHYRSLLLQYLKVVSFLYTSQPELDFNHFSLSLGLNYSLSLEKVFASDLMDEAVDWNLLLSSLLQAWLVQYLNSLSASCVSYFACQTAV